MVISRENYLLDHGRVLQSLTPNACTVPELALFLLAERVPAVAAATLLQEYPGSDMNANNKIMIGIQQPKMLHIRPDNNWQPKNVRLS